MTQELELRPQLHWFAQQMERVLRENDHKGGWSGDVSVELFNSLLYKYVDLYLIAFPAKGDRDYDDMVKMAIHVANFAMMIADNAYVCAEVERDDKQ